MDDGKSLKTFGYIADISEMLLNITFNGKNDIYNVSGNSYITIYNLAKIIAKKFNIRKIEFQKKKINKIIGNDPKKLFISSNLYFKEFNKKKFVDINKGVKFLIKYLYV